MAWGAKTILAISKKPLLAEATYNILMTSNVLDGGKIMGATGA